MVNLVNKKFELMLTGRAKAYSSSCPQEWPTHSGFSSFKIKSSFKMMYQSPIAVLTGPGVE